MLISKFGAESLPQKKKSKGKIYFYIVLMIAVFAGSYWIFQNYQRIIFNFKKDKYAEIIQDVNMLEEMVNKDPSSTRNIAQSEELLSRLIKDNPDDSYLYYLSGKLYYIETSKQVMLDGSKITEILFLDYIGKYKFPRYISYAKWEKGISHLRKSLLLKLQDKEINNATSGLLAMYLAGGNPYWESARGYLISNDQDSMLANIYHMIFTDAEPDWNLFTTEYGEETSTIWKAIYNLKIRNYPLAFFNLKKLLLSEDVSIRNSAYYLMGFIMGGQKNMALKMYYHSMINYDDFLKKYPWFLAEHNYTLRFMGQEAASRGFLGKYEHLVLELEEAL